MTGRELIIYILENKLEDEDVFKDGKFMIGLLSLEEAAWKMHVGVASVRTWVNLGMLPSVQIGDSIYIPANAELQIKEKKQNNA